MKRIISLGIFLSVCTFAPSQSNLFTGTYKYYVGTGNPDAEWNKFAFDDSAWTEGTDGIGYGDVIFAPHFTNTVEGYPFGLFNEGDTVIRTLIAPASSLYLRYPFMIESDDTAGISGFSLETYFDDGFIAYLNGAEFARVNLGKKGDTAVFNALTDRSHESQIAAGDMYPVAGYYISKKFLEEHLVIGENLIAVEVHNDSLAGSDLFFDCSLKKCLRDTVYDPLRSFWSGPNSDWVHIRTKAYVEADSTDLPLIIIESNEFGIPFSHVEVSALMKVIDHAGEGLNHPSDTSFTYDGPISIEIRGGSSQYFPKQPFNIETRNADGSNNNVSLLGMPAENDWALIGPISDRSLLRHTFTYELGRKQGHWEPRSKYCELILNGEYLGLYALTEKIKPDKNRLDISKLTDTDLFGDDVTGGYLFWKSGNWPVNISYPNSNKIQAEQEAYLEAYVLRYWDLIFSDNWLNGEIDYKDYVDTESMLDYMIICELSHDHDKYGQSTYMYKDRSDKDSLIHFGPLWDFNYAYGNSSESMATDKWLFNRESGAQFRRLFQDTILTSRFAEKWHSQRLSFLHTDSLYALIDSLSAHFADARKRDSMVWDAYTTVNVYFALDTIYQYGQVIHNLKDWIQRRVTWIDTWIDSIYFPYTFVEPESITLHNQEQKLRAYPNPFLNELTIELDCPSSGSLRLELYNAQGQLVHIYVLGPVWKGWQTHTLPIPDGIPSGLYNLSVNQNGKKIDNIRVVKTE